MVDTLTWCWGFLTKINRCRLGYRIMIDCCVAGCGDAHPGNDQFSYDEAQAFFCMYDKLVGEKK